MVQFPSIRIGLMLLVALCRAAADDKPSELSYLSITVTNQADMNLLVCLIPDWIIVPKPIPQLPGSVSNSVTRVLKPNEGTVLKIVAGNYRVSAKNFPEISTPTRFSTPMPCHSDWITNSEIWAFTVEPSTNKTPTATPSVFDPRRDQLPGAPTTLRLQPDRELKRAVLPKRVYEAALCSPPSSPEIRRIPTRMFRLKPVLPPYQAPATPALPTNMVLAPPPASLPAIPTRTLNLGQSPREFWSTTRFSLDKTNVALKKLSPP